MISDITDVQGQTHIILGRSIPKLGGEDFQQLSTPPSLLAVGIVRVVVGLHPPQPAFEVIRARPGIARRHCDIWRRLDGIRRGNLHGGVDGDEGQARRKRAASPRQISDDPRGGRQGSGRPTDAYEAGRKYIDQVKRRVWYTLTYIWSMMFVFWRKLFLSPAWARVWGLRSGTGLVRSPTAVYCRKLDSLQQQYHLNMTQYSIINYLSFSSDFSHRKAQRMHSIQIRDELAGCMLR